MKVCSLALRCLSLAAGRRSLMLPGTLDLGVMMDQGVQDAGPSDAGAPDQGLPDAGSQAPTFEQDVRPIIEARCTVCHTARNDLNLTGPDAASQLMQAAAAPCAVEGAVIAQLVVPGAPESSYLIRRLGFGNEGFECGRPMPIPFSNEVSGAGLMTDAPEEFDTIWRWIEGGAQ